MFDTKPLVSAMASIVFMRTITNELIPHELLQFFQAGIHHLFRQSSAQFTILIEEFQGMARNQVFEAAQAYLGTKATVSADRVKVSKSEDHKELAFNIDRNEEVSDVFEGVSVKWKLICIQVDSSRIRHYDNDSSPVSEIRSYELTFHKKHKNKIFDSYLPYVMEIAKQIKQGDMAIKIYSNEYSWSGDVKFNHPMSFDTLAIDEELQRDIKNDLDKFVRSREFYRRTGKAWKRGYLLYGPPGTGKSSLIAAMANYLNYDIYDLDLTNVQDNKRLKQLILDMSNRSILVIEDIDCTVKLQNREEDEEIVDNGYNKMTLSGLLNATDGLWSCCGEEHIIVFTTNHKDRLDPALLRPGRMDKQIHLSYCNFSAFKKLVTNYLCITEHELFEKIEVLLGEVQVTPAEIGEELTKDCDATECLQDLIKFLQAKKMIKEEIRNERSTQIKQGMVALKIHSNDYDCWCCKPTKFNHPMTFNTLAIDEELQREIKNDLDKFVRDNEFYRRTGKAWKRGYLLYGPPGTGKSSLIAAMANYLNYDIYDLDLTDVEDNKSLKQLILSMSNRAILVIEDIDCTINLQNREEEKEAVDNGDNDKVTLSGLLNAVDGLWSCCGEEHIIVFTTNHKERLDPALLRPGRIDKQIHLSYCNFSAFKKLIINYLCITEHELFDKIEVLLGEVQVTPAEIAEELTKDCDATECLQDLIKFLQAKKMIKEEIKIEENNKEEGELGRENI
ncbi:AAA-ATPase At3g50940 isoform X2 [Medicago truncatula]|uniref:AAA-ATPase At3g50940 isoform X2 n=1 Tax=Medicago truncatula TaxID=3880 RepID=UPI0019673DF7|nr:AAA-ATPase At3g50940-like isoform X2 [Medicago truncatula]